MTDCPVCHQRLKTEGKSGRPLLGRCVNPRCSQFAMLVEAPVPPCLTCGGPLTRAGVGWSGNTARDVWRCLNRECAMYGKRTMKHR